VKELEELSLDPKEKELRDYKRKVEAYEAKEKEAEAARQAEADSKAVAHWTQHYDTVLPKAITDAGLPLT
jgi:phosphoenolpyruvate-protein kinase (PTS system EI component)